MRGLLLAILLSVGCAQVVEGEIAPPFFSPLGSITLDIDGQPAWLERAARAAVQTWAKHGLDFQIAAFGDLPVLAKQPPPNALGVYWTSRQIWLTDEGADQPGFSCTLVHELGHAVGMMHVSHTGSLMSVVAGSWEDGTCLWTDLDEAELQRVIEQAATTNAPNTQQKDPGTESAVR